MIEGLAKGTVNLNEIARMANMSGKTLERRLADKGTSFSAVLADIRSGLAKRLLGRLVRKPGWLRPNWFDDQRIEPVMVAPHFEHPMYEALDRYDPHAIPGTAPLTTQNT